MKKFLVLIVALPLLGGCQAFEKARTFVNTAVETVVNPDTVENVMLSYNSAQNIALAYGRSCKAKLLEQSRCWRIVNELKPYEAQATRAVLAMDDFARANPNADKTSFILNAKRAIQAYKDTQFINGVK